MNIPERVRTKLKELPDKPGCYLMRDKRGRIIYVGKANSLRKRVQSYFRDSSLRRGSPKLRGLVRSIADIDLVVVRTEAEATLTESRLIKEYRPRYNVSFRDDKRFLLLRADLGQPFPRLRLCRVERDEGSEYFGPFPSSAAARATVDFIEKHYGLRKCGPRIPDEETHKHCINDIVRFCSAPCIGKVSEEEYRERVNEACAFLRGERLKVLQDVRESMEDAAGKRDYERAAALRDTLHALNQVVRSRSRIASTPEIRQAAATQGVKDLKRLLKLPALPHVIEAYDISNISGTYAVASMVCSVDGMPRKNLYRRFRIKSVTGSDDPAMMAEVIRRRYTDLRDRESPMPGLVLVDGGPTQLAAARAELAQLGLVHVPTAGLAKRFELVYVHPAEAPLELERNSPALQVLQRLRDEAHRFALDYHQRLRRKRIRESILDDIPGIGPQRKQVLLKHLGSLRRIEQATEEEIADVPGIGLETAKLIKAALREAAGSTE
ncbi:MAG: excinuclease ABC subunit UvrC [Kiritimatiellia bacterium]|jgi:excinuclease ABC subunit C|nr:excinuclease ABC subunit UvrC [Kiritimatiellia bacterium]MDP6629752.1 excinuclease ABC subunit UvrC [Kiritimatiellia bacterium]MDP6811028.1 excinuclease ABC subunit UvrC [Kiritimatiellia bacterium]MDP7023117.1 excinuclease ABC subunit UvrC [Kiritimatiellia bacterium]